MVRLRYDLNILTEEVKAHIIDPSEPQLAFQDLTSQSNKNLVVFEIKITKAKDGAKNMLQYHLFSQSNLRIYESLKTYNSDLQQLSQRSKELLNGIELLHLNTMQASSLNVNDVCQLVL